MPRLNQALVEAISNESDINLFLSIIYLLADTAIRQSKNEEPCLIELGTATGNSTIALLSAIEHNNRGKLFSIDIDKCDYAEQRIIQAGLYNYWYFTLNDSVNYASQFNKECDLVFIDTSHEAEQTEKEIVAWSEKVRLGGYIIFHDTMSRYSGVSIPIQNWLKKNKKNWKYYSIDAAAGLGVMTKIL